MNLSFRGAIYRSFRAPGLNNLYRSYSSPTFISIANPNLSPETLTGGELGADLHIHSVVVGATYFRYDTKSTTVSTTLPEILAARAGVCQDFAHLQIGCLRAMGLAARYVSGYLLTTPPPGRPRLVGADASHAWVSVYLPDAGWLDLDPTNNLIPSDKHITLAWGRDFGDVSPLRGVILGGGRHHIHVSVDVSPI